MKIKPQKLVRIKLMDHQVELKEFGAFTNDNVSADSTQVRESAFYKLIENANVLDASHITGNLRPPLTNKAFLVLAEVVATLESMTEVDFSFNNLNETGIEMARALATSKSISVINFKGNNSGSNALAYAEGFSKSSCLHTLIIDTNKFERTSAEFLKAILRKKYFKTSHIKKKLFVNY